MNKLNLDYIENLRDSSQINDVLDKYPLLAPIRKYVSLQKDNIKKSDKYKEAMVIAKNLGIPYDEYELASNNMEILAQLNSNRILYTLFEMDAFPEVLTEHLVVDCFIYSQYWHKTGLPDNVNEILPINVISIYENTDSHKFNSIAEAYLNTLPFVNSIGVAKNFEVYTDSEKFYYDINDLPSHAKKTWDIIRQTAKEWHQIALPLVKDSDITYPWQVSNLAWNAAPEELRNKHITAVRNLVHNVWEWHTGRELNQRSRPVGRCLPLFRDDYLATNASGLFHYLRNSISVKSFDNKNHVNDDRWPTANISNTRQTIKAMAQLKPNPIETPYLSDDELIKWQNKMGDMVISMSDLTADILDIIAAVWINKAIHPEETIDITSDDFLGYRGLKPQKSGTGRRGGYKKEKRQEIARQITILDNLWLTVFEMPAYEEIETKKGRHRKPCKWQGESKAIVVSSRMRQVNLDGTAEEAFAWRVRPGDCFTKFLLGPGRQIALLSQKALNYDPLKQKWEKRLTRYLSWLWRINYKNSEPLSVSTILAKGIMENVNISNPSRTKERFDKALDQLVSDNVISGWQYQNVDESIVGQRGWITNWLQWKVIVEPPQVIIDQYAKIANHKNKSNKKIKAVIDILDVGVTGAMLKEKRLLLGLTQLQTAEKIGISRPRISWIERHDDAVITKPELKKLKVWFEK